MGKTVKAAVGFVVAIGLVVAGVITMNPQLIITGLSIGISTLASVMAKGPKTSPSATDRLMANIDPRTPRKGVFGDTAMNTDIRDQEYTGSDKEYFHRFVVVASHAVTSIREIWFDDKLAWTAAGGVQGEFAGYLTVATRLEGNAGNAINISPRMGNTRRFTGCAYVHFRYKLTGNSKKTESPFASSVPSRVTIIGEGMPVYDARFDSTVPGGNGPARADDQTTWRYSYSGSNSGRNPACQMATYLLGWRIKNPVTNEWKLALGKAVPPDRLDLPSFITAANLCDEAVALAAGGTEPRYRGDGVFSEFDQATDVLDNLKAAMAAELDDMDGLIRVSVLHNDLAVPVLNIEADDVLGDYNWQPFASLETTRNVVRGTYVDPSTKSLYQMVPYPDVEMASPDGIERAEPVNYQFVQSPSQAQRLSKQRLQRAQFAGMFSAEFKSRLWKAQKGDVVSFTFAPARFAAKLFRVVDTAVQVNGRVPVTLREEHPLIYQWDNDEKPPVQSVAATPYTNYDLPLSQFLDTVETGANVTENHTAANTVAVGDRTAEAVNYDLDTLQAATTSQAYSIGQILLDVAALETTYGSTASAAASASAAQSYAATATTAAANAATARDQAQAARDAAITARTLAQTAQTNAETAASNAVSAATAAGGSATAAAGSATTASSHKDAAAGSATAAAASATTASTAASNASTSAGQAATSATNASGSASAAATSAATAATARDQAQSSATAAATSASNAAASATTAGQQASAAQTSATTATTQAGNAATSASQAATSATNAAGSASSASTSATTAAAAGLAATQTAASLLPDVPTSLAYWTSAQSGAPAAVADATGTIVTDTDFGSALEASGAASNRFHKGVVPCVAGRIYEYRLRVKISAAAAFPASYRALWLALDSAYTQLNGLFGPTNTAAQNVVSEIVTLINCDTILAAQPTTKWIRPGYQISNATTTMRVGLAAVRDVTAREAAAGSATAAASSASSAAASQTAAGNSASAAQGSATTAATQAGNASTSAGQAATSASNAATSASQASTSATNAAGSASSASTSATNAANSATAAGGSASAAATSASSASSYATAAGNSATAAAGSALTAQSVVAAALPFDFMQDGTFWLTHYTGAISGRTPSANGWTFPIVDGVKVAQQTTSGSDMTGISSPPRDALTTLGRITAVAGRRYRMSTRFKFQSWPAAPNNVALWFIYNTPDGVTHSGSSGPYIPTGVALNTWKDFSAEVTLPAGIPTVAPFIRGIGGAGAVLQIASLRLDDITSETAAGGSATAAATSASQASTSATNAGNSATSASASANTATTQAGAASTAASAAAASSASASNYAAAAFSSSQLSASMSGSLATNIGFDAWANAAGAPDGWVWYLGPIQRVADGSGGYAMRCVTTANNYEGTIYQDFPAARLQPGEYAVLELEASIASGNWNHTGVFLSNVNQADLFLRTKDTPTTDGTLAGTVAGRIYRWSKMVQVPAGYSPIFRLAVSVNWPNGIDVPTARDVTIYRANVRPASAEEIRAGTAIPALQASVSVQAGAITTLQGRSLAYLQSTVNAGAGTTAFVELRAEVAPGSVTSSVAIGAREVHIYTDAGGGAWKKTLSISGNDVLINGNLTATGGFFLGSGALWRPAYAARDFQISDGVAVAFGLNFGTVPQITFKADNLAPLNAGETYKLYADLATGTGFTPRLRIVTPGATTAYSLTVDTVPGTGPTRQIDKGANPDASNNVYKLRIQGTFTATSFFVNEGGGGGGGGGWNGQGPIP